MCLTNKSSERGIAHMNISSKDKNVEKFLKDIMEIDDGKFNILAELRRIVFMNNKTIQERMMYGGIMFSNEKDLGGVFVYKKHVSFEFSEGYRLDDPENLLQGTGKKRRHLKLYALTDISDNRVDFFVKQALLLT